MPATEGSAEKVSSSWAKHEPKKPRQCSYCGRRDGHNARNYPNKNSAAPSTPIPKVATINLDLSTPTFEPSPTGKLNGDAEFVSEKQVTGTQNRSLRNSACQHCGGDCR